MIRGAFFLRINEGVRRVHEDSAGISNTAPTILADLGYGDPFERDWSEPFDVFQVRAQVSPGGGGLNLLQASGRLYQGSLLRWGARTRHVFAINQRYDFIKNPVYSFGQQSLEAGMLSRFGVPRRFNIRTKLAVDAAVLGAIDAPYGGIGERTYDFGPGLGATLDARLERDGITYVALYNRGEYLHSVSGAAANHWIFFSGLEVTVPIKYGVGLGFYVSGDTRSSRYAGQSSANVRQFLETRLFVSFTTSRPASALEGR